MRRPYGFSHAAHLPRLMTMVGALVIMGMSIYALQRASRPARSAARATIDARDDASRKTMVSATEANARNRSTQATNKQGSVSAGANQTGRWDEDSEQRDAAMEEFQAVYDKTREIQPEEMPAYWRVMSWVVEQPFDSLCRRSRADFVINDLLGNPDANRGQLLRLDLNVCRVLSYKVPANRLGLTQLYEVWGWTGESQAWLYVGITPELPAGFPIGSDVSERAALCGYFFKLQGYLEAGAAPRATPLAAPLIIGRLDWRPRQKPGVAASDSPWLITLIALAGVLLLARVTWMAWRRNVRSLSVPGGSEDLLTTEEWLEGLKRGKPDTV